MSSLSFPPEETAPLGALPRMAGLWQADHASAAATADGTAKKQQAS
jgi:hypothetical protein